MLWKAVFITVLAIGAHAGIEVSEDQRNQFKTQIKEICKKNGAEDKADEVLSSITSFTDCVKGLFDADTLKNEIEEAKPRGALDEVFRKYCAKSPQLKTCINNLSNGVTPCVPNNFLDRLRLANNATDQLIDFVCYKDGDRIALFIAEGGPECFQQKYVNIQQCGTKLKDEVGSIEEAKKLSLDQQCSKYDELTACIVTALEECDSPTPGNMAESLFRFVRNGSPCPKKD